MTNRFKLLTALYFAALAATVTGLVLTDRPWSAAIAWCGFVILAVLYALLRRTPLPAKAAPADADPDPVCPCGAPDDGPHTLTCQES